MNAVGNKESLVAEFTRFLVKKKNTMDSIHSVAEVGILRPVCYHKKNGTMRQRSK